MWIKTKLRLACAALALTGASLTMTGMVGGYCPTNGERKCSDCDSGPAGQGWYYASVIGYECEKNWWYDVEEFYDIGGEEDICVMVENECDVWSEE